MNFSPEVHDPRDLPSRSALADKPRAQRLAAQYGDYWHVCALNRVEETTDARNAIDAACRRLGRDPATLRKTVCVLADLPGVGGEGMSAGFSAYRAARKPLTGSTEEMAAALCAFARVGVEHVQLWVDPISLAGMDAFAPVLELFDAG